MKPTATFFSPGLLNAINASILCTFLAAAGSAFAQAWTKTGALSQNWEGVACSADGAKIMAASYQGNYASTNAGASWATNSLRAAFHVASSPEGSKLAASASGSIHTSTNSGATWTSNKVYCMDVSGMASSADGTKLVAVNPIGNGGHIYTSADAGTTWLTNSLSGRDWKAVASSADGSKLVAAATGAVYTSTNSGVAWVSNNPGAPFPYWTCVASSADGTRLAAGIGGNGDVIYTSTNSGSSWTPCQMPEQVWSSLACSADGSKLVAAAGNNGTIYTSTDSGSTWLSNSVPRIQWIAVASSADGNRLVALANGGGIYTLQAMSPPRLSITPSGKNLTVSWTVPSANFVLQESSDLISWTNAAAAPTLNLTNLQDQVSLSASNRISFCRLATP